MDIITLTTDFGEYDGYPAAMKGVILGIKPNVKLIDITHSILPQNIVQGAFILYSVVNYFKNAIHIGVVDPGVGTNRDGLVVKCTNGILVGPDNGLLIPAGERLGLEEVYKITNQEYWLKTISSTFHGRDIFAPVAAQISKGISIGEVGAKVDQYVKLDLFEVKESDSEISGSVLNIDRFGNVITNISKEIIDRNFKLNDDLKLYVKPIGTSKNITKKQILDNFLNIPYKKTYNDVVKGSTVAIISSSGFLEFAGNQCNANEILKLSISDKINIKKF